MSKIKTQKIAVIISFALSVNCLACFSYNLPPEIKIVAENYKSCVESEDKEECEEIIMEYMKKIHPSLIKRAFWALYKTIFHLEKEELKTSELQFSKAFPPQTMTAELRYKGKNDIIMFARPVNEYFASLREEFSLEAPFALSLFGKCVSRDEYLWLSRALTAEAHRQNSETRTVFFEFDRTSREIIRIEVLSNFKYCFL